MKEKAKAPKAPKLIRTWVTDHKEVAFWECSPGAVARSIAARRNIVERGIAAMVMAGIFRTRSIRRARTMSRFAKRRVNSKRFVTGRYSFFTAWIERNTVCRKIPAAAEIRA